MSSDPAGVSLRRLTEADFASLESFSCKGYRQPWTEAIEWSIQQGLADSIRLGAVSAIGTWSGITLCGLAAWGISPSPPPICQCHLVAVRIGYQGRGLGRLLKGAVIEEAVRAGCRAVTSFVHWDNRAMIQLNSRLGANIEAMPGDHDYCLCTIPLPRPRAPQPGG